MKSSTIATATALALTTAIISGAANFFNKFAVTAISNPVLFTTLKNTIVAVLLLGVVIALRKHREIRALSKKQWLSLAGIGVIGGALPFALFFTGLSQTAAVNAALIHKTLFLFVAILALPLLGERMRTLQWVGIALIFGGNLFVGGFSGFKYNTGELMILTATVLWAVENIIAKKALATISSQTVAAARMVIGSVLLSAYIAVTSGFAPVVSLNSMQWGWTILTAAFLMGYVLTWYSALKLAPATYVATLLVPATLVTNVLSALFITHKLLPRDIASAGLYAAGIALVIIFARKTVATTHLTATQ